MSQILDPLFLIQTVGLIGVVFIVFIESGLFFGFFFPGDSLLFTAGFLASQGYFSILELSIGSFIAAIAGASFGYAFGRHVGPAIFAKEDSFFFHRRHIQEASDFYDKHGKLTLILSRFMPVVRTFAPIVAGVGRMKYSTFVIFNAVGAAIWSFGFCLGGYFLGSIIPSADKYILPIVIVIILTSFLPAGVAYLRKKFKKKENITSRV